MPRSPTDATRFTATGPYASSPPATNPRNLPLSTFDTSPAPNETPQQKLARLRAARHRQMHGPPTLLTLGRSWADRLHRFTTLSLITITLVSAAVATAGITDMVMHNRRRRGEWLAQKQAETAAATFEAKRALGAGEELTEEQMLLVSRDRAAREVKERREREPGWGGKVWGWVTGGLEREEEKGGRLRGGPREREVGGDVVVERRKDEDNVVMEGMKGEDIVVLEAGKRGGPLDREAERAVGEVADRGRGWMNWLTGR